MLKIAIAPMRDAETFALIRSWNVPTVLEEPTCCICGGRALALHTKSNGFSIVREFVGHGVGRSMHEAPQVPNFTDARYSPKSSPKLRPGMTLAIEPMVNAGSPADFPAGVPADS